ncbi:hypothetical protein [Sporosarcina sp. YIM B06819]|uniref:hypothetical protein n=1 Tax=Sporosarcina sp. YIM B06819 TaxID=3081769 RepID=UPI00298CEB01|nr:hypothetical protein [Sporosarcina sp. YIM B06819]
MKSKWNLLYAAIATALLLTACGTDTSNDNLDSNSNGSPNPVEETDKGTVEEPDTTEPTPDDTAGGLEDSMADAILTVSDAQDYEIAVLPNYTLTSEEPGKDSLFSNADGSLFMRIETTIKEEGTYDYLVENMIAVLEATSGGSTPTELSDAASIPTGDGIEHAKVLSVQTDNGPVTGIVFERDSMIVRLTIFDSPKEEHFSNFLHMGETIVAK